MSKIIEQKTNSEQEMNRTENEVLLEEGKVKYSETKMSVAVSLHLMLLHYKPVHYVHTPFCIISLQFEYVGLRAHIVDLLIAK